MGRPALWVTLTCNGCQREFAAKPHKARKGQRFCSNACRRSVCVPPKVVGNQHAFKGDAAGAMAKRMRAQKLFSLGTACERCSGRAEVRHHKDENPGNNAPENIERLCRPCHINHHRASMSLRQGRHG